MPAKPIVKRPPKTLKQKRWVQKYLETGNATEAAMQVYNASSRDSAKRIGNQNVTNLDFIDVLEKQGLSDNRLAQKLDDLMEAQRTVSAVAGKDANAGTVDFVDVPDNPVQLKALEMALKLKDRFPSQKVEQKFDFGQVIKHADQYVD